jgi:ATP phosphoribosyltransferase regulatory subunit
MSAETALKFEALERQAQTVMGVFATAGHEIVAPSIIQPADVFLDCIGEAVRARTYVFTDPDGAELCLRPDLTVPACRLHIARHADPATPAQYAYNGPAFRFQPQGKDATHPREFRQAGIERFGDKDAELAEATVIILILEALKAAGLKNGLLQLGDLGLFAAVLEAARLPPRWQKRLSETFWKPDLFRDELKRLKTDPGANAKRVPAGLAKVLNGRNLDASTAAVAEYLERNAIEAIGTRTVAEMTADRAAPSLDAATAKLIESYIAVSGPARTAGAKIAALLKDTKNGAGAVLSAYDRRLALLANAGVDLDRVSFSAEFGRNLEYYTGLVFEVVAPELGDQSPVAGGGRYDRLMRAAGAKADVPAVGGAIHTERLLQAVSGGRS